MESSIQKRCRNGRLWKSLYHLFVVVIFSTIIFAVISHVFLNKEHNWIKLKRQFLHIQFLEQIDTQNRKGG
jgi:hypothetical protein